MTTNQSNVKGTWNLTGIPFPWNALLSLCVAFFLSSWCFGNVDDNIDPTKAEITGEIHLHAFTFKFSFIKIPLRTLVSLCLFFYFCVTNQLPVCSSLTKTKNVPWVRSMTSFKHYHLGNGIIAIATEPLSFSTHNILTDGKEWRFKAGHKCITYYWPKS